MELTADIGYGIESTELVKKLCQETTNLVATVILFKKLLHKHELDKPFFGGINSYILIMMAMAYLKSTNEAAIRKSFIGMLEYYGKIFDPREVAIIGGFLVLVGNKFGGLYISDPYRPYINIAHNVTRFKEIQACFVKCHEELMLKRKNWFHEYIEGAQILDNILN